MTPRLPFASSWMGACRSEIEDRARRRARRPKYANTTRRAVPEKDRHHCSKGQQDNNGTPDVGEKTVVKHHEIQPDADEAEQLRPGAGCGVVRIEPEQGIFGDGLGPYRGQDFELARIEKITLQDIGLFRADEIDSFL